MSGGEWVLAVDLGTTRTRAAYTCPGSREPVLVRIPPGQASWLASSVARDPDGGWLVGEDAERLRTGWTEAYFRNAKRLLGQVEPHYFDGHPFSVLELFAQPLIHVAMLARAQADHVFDRLALAAPVEFEGFRRELLIQAGELAGFPPSRISVTTEAEAAARAALGPAPADGTWLLFDMGGGTLDVALLRTRAGGLNLLDTFGTNGVSGYVLDSAIMEHLRAAYPIGTAAPEADGQDTSDGGGLRRETLLRDTAELAKTGVTARREGRATLPEPRVNVALPPDALRKLASPVIGQALGRCEELLSTSGLRWDELTAIVCVGGSTRGPVIRELLAARAPVRDTVGTPELAVVLGLLVPPARLTAAHPKTIRPANAGGAHLLRTLAHPGPVTALAFSPSGNYLATASGHAVEVWNPADGAKLWTLDDHTDTVTALAFAADGRLASGSTDQTIRLRFPGRDGDVRVCEAGTTVHSAAFSASGALLAWGGGDHRVHLWAGETGADVAEPFTGHEGPVLAAAFAPDDSVLATAAGSAVRLWDPVDGTVRAVLAGHTGNVARLAFSADGTRLATASHDHTVRVWDPELGTCRLVFGAHGNYDVRAVSFPPAGGIIASGGNDKHVRLWNPETGDHFFSPGTHGREITTMAFSPDGTLLASGSHDGEVRIWGLG